MAVKRFWLHHPISGFPPGPSKVGGCSFSSEHVARPRMFIADPRMFIADLPSRRGRMGLGEDLARRFSSQVALYLEGVMGWIDD